MLLVLAARVAKLTALCCHSEHGVVYNTGDLWTWRYPQLLARVLDVAWDFDSFITNLCGVTGLFFCPGGSCEALLRVGRSVTDVWMHGRGVALTERV